MRESVRIFVGMIMDVAEIASLAAGSWFTANGQFAAATSMFVLAIYAHLLGRTRPA